jgi:hypothetical protein
MPSGRFEPAVPASELPQTHALESAATRIWPYIEIEYIFCWKVCVIETSVPGAVGGILMNDVVKWL